MVFPDILQHLDVFNIITAILKAFFDLTPSLTPWIFCTNQVPTDARYTMLSLSLSISKNLSNLSLIIVSETSNVLSRTFSSFDISSIECSFNTWVYKSIVICKVACPKYCCTVFGLMPASKHLVAKECLKQCGEQ